MKKLAMEKDFEVILAETQMQIRAFIARMGVSLDTVDDIAQEVYLEFYKNLDKTPEGVEPIRWLKGMARNLCMNYFRRSKRQQVKHLEAIADVLAWTQDAMPTGPSPAQEKALGECMEKLAPKQNRIVKLRYEKGLNSSAIAEITGSKAGAVRIALMRTLKGLRDCMEEHVAPEVMAVKARG
jgi:RNA polymerase sigma-70 factor (ECF subfamily)